MRQPISIAIAILAAVPAQAQIPAPANGAAGPMAAQNARRSAKVSQATGPAGQRSSYHRPPAGGAYYRPPAGGGYYRPPPPPPGGWRGGYYPPPHYVYVDNGPSAGEVFAGVAVTSTLIAVLANASKPKTATPPPVGAPPPAYPPPPAYAPPPGSTGAPAKIAVDLGGLTPEARPSASTCIAEASRQIGATGGIEIGIAQFDKVEPGNGGYRLNMTLLATYPDAKRKIAMFCRATPEKIVELKFGQAG